MTEIAEAEKISKSYVSRILRLALLAPDLVEAILGGWAGQLLEAAAACLMGKLHAHMLSLDRGLIGSQ